MLNGEYLLKKFLIIQCVIKCQRWSNHEGRDDRHVPCV